MKNLLLMFGLVLMLAGDYLSDLFGIGFGLGVISTFVMGLFCYLKYSRQFVIRKIDILIVASVSILLLMSQMARIIYPTEYNVAYSKDFIIYFFYTAIILKLMRTRSFVVARSVDLFLILILVLAFFQWTYISFGLGINPSNHVGFADTGSDIYIYGVRSIFFNPNNFSAVCVTLAILYCLKTDLSERKRLILLIVLSTFTLVAGSRACALADFLVLVAYSQIRINRGDQFPTTRRSRKKMVYLFCIAIALVVVIVLGRSSDNSKSYWSEKIDKIPTLIDSMLIHGDVHDHSVNERLGVYREYFDHFAKLGLGGLHAQNYGNVITVNSLMAKNPHSLFVELSLLYGYPGLLAFLLLFAWLYITMYRGLRSHIRTVLVLMALLLVTFVPSSVMNVPQLWALYLIIGCLSWELNVGDKYLRNRSVQFAEGMYDAQ